MEIPAKVKDVPNQLKKASKMHAKQSEIVKSFLDDYAKKMEGSKK
tara:strand:+ start:526 stop:660 length:135 start_codon:yes stop_codon:yes gene_type:complete